MTSLEPSFHMRQGLVDDLIHVQILVGATAADEGDVLLRFGKGFVLVVEFIVAAISGFYRVVAFKIIVAVVAGFFARDGVTVGVGGDVVGESVPGGFAGDGSGIGEVGDAPGLNGCAWMGAVVEF